MREWLFQSQHHVKHFNIISINHTKSPYMADTISITITSHSASPTIVCKTKYPEEPVKMQIQNLQTLGSACESAFLTSS